MFSRYGALPGRVGHRLMKRPVIVLHKLIWIYNPGTSRRQTCISIRIIILEYLHARLSWEVNRMQRWPFRSIQIFPIIPSNGRMNRAMCRGQLHNRLPVRISKWKKRITGGISWSLHCKVITATVMNEKHILWSMPAVGVYWWLFANKLWIFRAGR